MINQIEPWITSQEIKLVTDCVSSTFVTEGKYTDLLEKEIQKLHGTRYQPVAYCNATLGLYACLKILGLKRGQEVIIPALTFVATANAIIMAGGVPVCVDVEDGFKLNADKVRQAITPKTFAIMPVHLYGHFTNLFELKKICDDHRLKMIEDASQGVGVSDGTGNYAATIGDAGVLSFYGNKFVTSAQGGMIVSSSEGFLEDARRFKNHGRAIKGTFWHEEIGYNFCTTDLHSALGVAQLNRFDEIRKRKEEVFENYKLGITDGQKLKLDNIDTKNPCYWFISVFAEDARALELYLKTHGIQSRRAFPPLSLQPCYQEKGDIIFHSDEAARRLYNCYLSLPSSANLSADTIIKICEVLNKF